MKLRIVCVSLNIKNYCSDTYKGYFNGHEAWQNKVINLKLRKKQAFVPNIGCAKIHCTALNNFIVITSGRTAVSRKASPGLALFNHLLYQIFSRVGGNKVIYFTAQLEVARSCAFLLYRAMSAGSFSRIRFATKPQLFRKLLQRRHPGKNYSAA